jgi:hypothetical protein
MLPSPPKVRVRIGTTAVAVWFSLMVVLGAGLLARHAVAFAAPAPSPRLVTSLNALRTARTTKSWLAVHVLYGECRCSQRIADHLLATNRLSDWSEIVLWIGSPAPPAALEKQFDVRRIAPAELATYGIESAPMLIAADAEGQIRYAGGYTDRKQGPIIDDLRILREARDAGGLLRSLPIFGCAVSERLKRSLSLLPVP